MCPTSADGADIALVDTSVAVALVLGDHVHRGLAIAALAGRAAGLSGHAAFEVELVATT